MSNNNLYAASNQWMTRPADERFWTLGEMHAQCQAYRDSAGEATLPMHRLKVIGGDGANLAIVGPKGNAATLTHWGFGQLANRVGAPAEYLRRLPQELACQNLNHGLTNYDQDAEGRLFFHRNGSLVCRCITSDKYTRIFNSEVTERLLPLLERGWRVPPARPAMANQPGTRKATKADLIRQGDFGLSVQEGDLIAPAGLYASDHDMFAFLVNEERRIEDGSDGGLSRGFFISNSEVGAASLKLTAFLYRHVCGNHIVWGAEGVKQLRIVHRGDADARFDYKMRAELRTYADAAASEDEARITAAKKFVLGGTKQEVLDKLFGEAILPRKTLDLAYQTAELEAEEHKTGSPRTAWGFANGITRMSQDTVYADERNKLDRAAGRVLALAVDF